MLLTAKGKEFNILIINSSRGLQIGLLRINQEVVTDPKNIVEAWEGHFRVLSSVNLEQPSVMYSSEDEVETLMLNSLDNEDSLLDVLFVSEEVDSVLRKLKLGKAAGHDGIRAEHLKYGGPMLRDWIVLGPPPSRSRDLELEGGVIACHVDYVYEPQDSHVRGTE